MRFYPPVSSIPRSTLLGPARTLAIQAELLLLKAKVLVLRTYLIATVSAYISTILNNFVLPFMEGSIITFARLGLLSKELVGLTIKDPRILTLATVDKRLLPCYMPLVCNSEYDEYCLCVSKAISARLFNMSQRVLPVSWPNET